MGVCLGFGGRHVGEVLDHFLGVLGLTSAGLSSAENTLVLAILNKQNFRFLLSSFHHHDSVVTAQLDIQIVPQNMK